ncbi:uncharacterized protein LOC118348163 [Juglans regia]|uniref:Uncharacterized protein LOC118348163 n=1 Tax=Juglans regia TaxID=51240 RepID=A0A6P9EMC8_JUGRE|nr:uncharacterized protein LOC118348163 [Juglans regia]
MVANALSRREEESELVEESLAMISFPNSDWVMELKESHEHSPEVQEMFKKLQEDSSTLKGYQIQEGLLLKKRRIVVVPNSSFKSKGMKKDIKRLVRECDTYQKVKYKTTPPAWLLQPLLVPQQAWIDISMDFIEGLLVSQGQNGIDLHHNFAYHPQTDGQTEALNKYVEGYLRCYAEVKL